MTAGARAYIAAVMWVLRARMNRPSKRASEHNTRRADVPVRRVCKVLTVHLLNIYQIPINALYYVHNIQGGPPCRHDARNTISNNGFCNVVRG